MNQQKAVPNLRKAWTAMPMRTLKLIVLTLVLPPSVAAADVQAAVRAHMECVVSKAKKMDDGQMDARRLAQLIIPLCHVEHDAAMQASSPQSWSKTAHGRAQEVEFDHTTAAVLFYGARVKGP